MNPQPDDDLLAIFSHARRCDREDTPAWRPELLEAPRRRPSFARRWVPAALVTACVIVLGVYLTHAPQSEPSLSQALPPLLDSPPGELFASMEPELLAFEAPSDAFLTDPFNLTIP